MRHKIISLLTDARYIIRDVAIFYNLRDILFKQYSMGYDRFLMKHKTLTYDIRREI